MAQNPEESEHTSVKARITALQKNISAQVTIAEFIGSK
jgi:hypothetical protein